jgi:hypothetical protein
MSTRNNFQNQHFNRKPKQVGIMDKKLIETTLYIRLVLIICSIILLGKNADAQKGLFVKFSLGPGFTTEYSKINGSGIAIATKNHSIGWGITDKFALQIGEFGSLIKQKVNGYNYINTDAIGLGFIYRTPIDLKISFIGAYSKVSFAEKWSQAFGDDGGNGYGINTTIYKEWFVAKRWGIGLGPQIYWIKTMNTDYEFLNVSINGSIVFYLTPVR